MKEPSIETERGGGEVEKVEGTEKGKIGEMGGGGRLWLEGEKEVERRDGERGESGG